MKKFISCLLAVFLCHSLTPISHAQTAAPKYSLPLGIAMEEFSYPHPVKYLPLEIEGEPVRMAYMDVQTIFFDTWAPLDNVVVLLHGKNFYGSYWENTINALAAQGYRVIVPDQIGFGKSSKPDIASVSYTHLTLPTKRIV